MTRSDLRIGAAISLLSLLLGACATALDEAPDRDSIARDALAGTSAPPAWAAPAGDVGAVDDGWLASFNDPLLEALVAEALDTQNLNMRILSAQVDRAEALARLGGAALQPAVSLGADLSETGGDDRVNGTSSSAGVAASWEADVWGRVRAGANAAEEGYRATVADFAYARQSLAAGVAKSWYLATELQLQEDFAAEVVELMAELVRLVETKQRIGEITMEDVHLVRADLNSAEDALRQVVGGQKQARRSLEILLGRYPAAEIETPSELVPVPPAVPAGLPSDLLERRPDLVAAERRVAAAFFLSEEARLARLPRFTLTASVGRNNDLDDLVGNIGAGLFAPLFDGGALEARLDAANADQQAAIAAYGLAVLRALEEVEASLTNEVLFSEREQFLRAAAENNRAALAIATTRYDVGETDLLSLLQVQARWIGSRISLISIQHARLEQRINLHLVLGGSFESLPSP
jgi:multidrug efflux system outer membrane protein